MIDKKKMTHRLIKKIVTYVCILIDVIMLPLAITIVFALSLILYGRRSAPKKSIAIFVGLEHVIDKTVIRADQLKNAGYKIYYYSFESTGNRSIGVNQGELLRIPRLICLDIIYFTIILIKSNPKYVEIYPEYLGIRQICYSIISNINNTINILILRGLYNNKPLKFKLRGILCQLPDFIFYRETYMLPILTNTYHINLNRTYFDPNKVHIHKDIEYRKDQKNILFLNGFKKWRNIDIIIRSVKYVIAEIPEAKFSIVGARNEKEYALIQRMIDDEMVEKHVDLYYWTNNANKFYEESSLFVLPADLVYCNFSLLEAMERGLPAIVANVEDAEKIIDHGINGYLCEQNEEQLAHYIIKLLRNEKLRQQMGENARNKIINDFNDSQRMVPILKLINKRYGDQTSKN